MADAELEPRAERTTWWRRARTTTSLLGIAVLAGALVVGVRAVVVGPAEVEPPAAAAGTPTSGHEIVGSAPATPEEIGAEDRTLRRDGPPILPQLCAPEPSGARSTDGSTTPYLGCEFSSGVETRGEAVTGPTAESLAVALSETIASHLRQLGGIEPRVELVGGDATVDLPVEFEDATSYPAPGGGADLSRSLAFTAYSNSSVDSIRFTVEGDCLRYAFAMGGDTCGTTHFTR